MHPLTRAVIQRSPARLRKPVALVARTVDAAIADRLPGLAAEIAFWTLLSLPALLLTTVATLGVFAGQEAATSQEQLIDRIVELASVALTTQVLDAVVRPVLQQVVETAAVPLVSVGFLVTVWTASRAVKVILTTTALTYGVEEPSGFGHRLLGLALTIVGIIAGLVMLPLLVAGPGLGQQLSEWLGINGELLSTAWRLAYWPAAILVATFMLASLYHLGAPWHTRWRRALPGAVVATTVWLLGSAGLRLYGAWVGEGGSVYGPLAGPIVGLLWLWIAGLAVLLGAELNGQVEQLWPSRHEAEAGRLKRQISALTSTGRLDFDFREHERDSASRDDDEHHTQPAAPGERDHERGSAARGEREETS